MGFPRPQGSQRRPLASLGALAGFGSPPSPSWPFWAHIG